MCGIAGYTRSSTSTLDANETARVLMASVADRGADAAGCAWVDGSGSIVVDKQPGGALGFLERLAVPEDLCQLILHVRDHTKGRPSLHANNHPIRHGSIVGAHNGKILNDEDLFAQFKCGREEPGMSVDSEAIFAALNRTSNIPDALESLRGSLAVAWFDERRPGSVYLARGYGRPLWIGTTRDGTDLMWASTLEALEITEDFLNVSLHKRPVRPGVILELRDGKIVAQMRFTADHTASWLRNPVASPDEREACLAQLDVRTA